VRAAILERLRRLGRLERSERLVKLEVGRCEKK
jgi:hypothetical protein